jgi:MFS family permease
MAGFVALAISYILSQFYRSFLAVLAPVLGSELNVSPGELAAASAAWFVMFALMQFPVGYWLDKKGPRLTAAIPLGLAGGGGVALFAASQSGLHLIIAMGLIGIGCAPMLMAAIYLFARNYRPATFATLSSTFIAIGTLGNVVASAPMAAAAQAIGWRNASWVLCIITMSVGLAIYLFVRDPERDQHQTDSANNNSYLALLRIRALWPILPCILLGYAVAAGVRGLWAGPYLERVHGMNVTQIGNITLYMALALVAGSLLYGPLDRLVDSRKKVVLVGNLLVMFATAGLAFSAELPEYMVIALFIIIGIFGASYAVQIAHGKAFIPPQLAGRGITLMNFFSMGGVGIMQLATGSAYTFLLNDYNVIIAFRAVFILYSVMLGLALIIYLFSTDARPSQA